MDEEKPVCFGDTRHPHKSVYLDPCIPRSWIKIFNILLIIALISCLIYSINEFEKIGGDEDTEIKKEKMRIIGATVSFLGIILWPVLWNTLIGYAVIVHHPLTLFGFLWPMVWSLVDLSYASTSKSAVQAQKVFGIGGVTADANTLVGVAFAIGSLLTSQANSVLADATIPLLMYSLLLLIAFIVPTPSIDPDEYSGFALGTIQRTFFNYAMGFVITGICINVSGQNTHALQIAMKNLCDKRHKDYSRIPFHRLTDNLLSKSESQQ